MTPEHDHDPEIAELLRADAAPKLSEGFYDRLTADLVNEVVEPVEKKRSKGRLFRIITPPIAVAAVALVAVMIAGQQPQGNTGGPAQLAGPAPTSTAPKQSSVPNADLPITLAAQVIAKASASYATVNSVSGKSTSTEYCPQHSETCITNTVVEQFKFRAPGQFWRKEMQSSTNNGVPGTSSTNTSVTNEVTGKEQYLYDYVDGPKTFSEYTNVGLGAQPIVWRALSLTELLGGLSVDDNAALEDTTLKGQPVWKISKDDVVIRGNSTPIRVEAYFDKATYFPVRVNTYQGGSLASQYVLEDLTVNPTLTDKDFVINHDGVENDSPTDFGFRRVQESQLQKLVSYKAVKPTFVPDGFNLVAISFNPQVPGDEGLTGATQEVTYLYRKGTLSFAFDTRKDQVSTAGGLTQDGVVSRFTLGGGALAGNKAQIVLDGSSAGPRLELQGGGVYLTISGDLTNDEFQQVAESAAVVP